MVEGKEEEEGEEEFDSHSGTGALQSPPPLRCRSPAPLLGLFAHAHPPVSNRGTYGALRRQSLHRLLMRLCEQMLDLKRAGGREGRGGVSPGLSIKVHLKVWSSLGAEEQGVVV